MRRPESSEFTPIEALDPYMRAYEEWLVRMVRSAVPEPPPLPAARCGDWKVAEVI